MTTFSALLSSIVTQNAPVAQNIDATAEETITIEAPPAEPIKGFSTNATTDETLKRINLRKEYQRLVSMSSGDIARMSRGDQMRRVARLEEFAKAERPKAPAKPMSVQAQKRLAEKQSAAQLKKMQQNSQGRFAGEKKASAPGKGKSR